MNMIRFDEGRTQFDIAILIKESSLVKNHLHNYYVGPLRNLGVNADSVVAMPLIYGDRNKFVAKSGKDHIEYLKSYISKLGVNYILCADANYYKILTKEKKAEGNLDKAVHCCLPGLEHIKVCYILNYSSLMYNPAQQDKIDLGLATLANAMNGVSNEIKMEFTDARYPTGVKAIQAELDNLHQYPELGVDIEAFSLKLGKAGIGSIAFSWGISEGCAFLVDYMPINPVDGFYGIQKRNEPVRKILKQFFEEYQGNMTFHGSAYDLKQLVWELWMKDPLDYEGMMEGVEVLTRNFDDSRFIAFLCLNSTTRPNLTLKALGYPYAGDYGEEEIKDIRKIDPFQLLKYNLTDTCVTLWVKDEYWDRMFAEEQQHVYQDFLDMQKVLLVTELHGMPMNEARLNEVDKILCGKRDDFIDLILDHPLTEKARNIIVQRKVDEDNKKLKTKKRRMCDYPDFEFNPGSDQQLAVLLHDVMQLPVLKYTPTKAPKTDADTIKLLIHKTNKADEKELLQTIIDYSEVSQVINTFIKAFKEGMLKADGRRYLHGNFNIAKVKSGRLSSSDPNLQNIPAGSTYGKLIKSIFQAPEGKLWMFADFNSLEDYISALLSKDRNKLKVYLGHEIYLLEVNGASSEIRDDSILMIDGVPTTVAEAAEQCCENFEQEFPFDSRFNDMEKVTEDVGNFPFTLTKIGNSSPYDGHALRAYSYFPETLGHLPDTVAGINSIKKDDLDERQESKGPTFQLTYGGTHFGLMDKFGFSEEKAKAIDTNYHTLYVESDEYKEKRLQEAAELGYMVLAFGLRIRCPLLSKTIRNSNHKARGAAEDERTLGNAMGQSYGMLNNRSMIAFMNKVWASKWRTKIFPIAPIHDASYYVAPDDIEAVDFVNRNLIKEMQWQEDPLIWHPRVRIGAELDIAYPSWAETVTIPNEASKATIIEKVDAHLAYLEEKGIAYS